MEKLFIYIADTCVSTYGDTSNLKEISVYFYHITMDNIPETAFFIPQEFSYISTSI
jgi:hypothetical protein